jgi:hypothetical protein
MYKKDRSQPYMLTGRRKSAPVSLKRKQEQMDAVWQAVLICAGSAEEIKD